MGAGDRQDCKQKCSNLPKSKMAAGRGRLSANKKNAQIFKNPRWPPAAAGRRHIKKSTRYWTVRPLCMSRACAFRSTKVLAEVEKCSVLQIVKSVFFASTVFT
jgi:hypothetical protein